MSVIYNASQAIQDCVIHIDAKNPRCYPGSGQTVFDISGNNKNGTLSGPVFNANGYFSFDGVNDVIHFGTGSTIFPLPQISFEFQFRQLGTVPTTGTLPGLCGTTYGVRLFLYPSYINASVDDGTTFIGVNTTGTLNLYNGAWNHVLVTHDGHLLKIYLNGVFNNSIACTWRGVTRWPGDAVYIGRDNNNSMYYFYGDIGIFRLYKTALSANQVAQNFQQIRGRYDI